MSEGPQRRIVWPRLLALAGHPEQDVAVWAIELLAAHPEEAALALRSCLQDRRASVRAAALEALAGSNGFTDEFLRLASDHMPKVRQAAALRLGDTGSMSDAIASAVRNLLRPRVEEVRQAAMRAVAIRGPVQCGASALVARLARNDPSESVREQAIDCIPECGLSPAEAVALLRRCLTEDAEDRPRRAAAFSLGVVAEQPGGRKAALAGLPELIARLTEEAVRAIARIGPDAVPGLITALRKHGTAGACKALGLIGDAEPALPALVDALSSPSRATREEAARAVGTFGRPAPDAVPSLRRMLWADTEGEVEATITGLVGIGATAAFHDLARMAQGEQQPALALWAVARLGDASVQLRQALDSPREDVRAIAAVERARLGTGPAPSIADLFAVSGVPALRPWLLEELAQRDDPALLPAAVAASRSGGHPLHSFGMEVLEQIGSRDPEAAVKALVSAFQCHNEVVLRGLGKFGFGSRLACATILRRMSSCDPAVRAAGVAALRRLLPPSPPVS